jgi:predicted aldo/keto reductase-like oxidoreductase
MCRQYELNENLQVGRQPRKMNREEGKALMECVGKAGKGFCRNCGYCLPCPEEILVPDILRFKSYYDRYNLKEWAREQYQSLVVNTNACTGCGQCLELCPYAVSTPEKLKSAHRTLQCQNPPPNSGIKTEISRLWSIPDHQEGIRCKAPRSDD